MLKEVIKFKNSIDKWSKYDKHANGMYVLCTTRVIPDEKITWHYNTTKSYIRRANVTKDTYVRACKKCSGLNMTLDGAIAEVDFNEVDKSQFLLECSILGIMPDVEFIDSEGGQAIDEIDLTTGISYMQIRKEVLEKRHKKELSRIEV